MLSIVVPVYNEEESLEAFYDELKNVVVELEKDYEVLFIDDGSSDSSLEMLKTLAKKDDHIRVFSFRKNQGKAEALTCGFQKAKGEIIVTLDADLQDKPSEIKKLLEKQKETGADMVSGWRKDRKDKSKMVVISRMFNKTSGRLFDVSLHDYNCGLKVYTKDAAKSLRLYGGRHRFIPILLTQQGFTVDEEVVQHEQRKYGKSKYGFSKVFKDLPDIFTMFFLMKYSKKPLHFFGFAGGGLFTLGFLILSYLAIIWFMGESIGRRPLLTFGMLFLLGGLQIFFTGFIAELITSQSQPDKQHFSLKYSTDK